ncbi:MAG: 2-polyprenyl-3-methyl-5-hydroxy-6-metoxy-1,4-benzoquinol methylase [Candidatus Paceibacteria bacterium]|jgi:2-polyprenyl-3-methyl-5-hydroxy-6-metoxy-1,4-benzoquinol methylase
MDVNSNLPHPLRSQLKPGELLPQCEDLGIDPESLRSLQAPGNPGEAEALVALVDPGQGPIAETVQALRALIDLSLAPDGAFFLYLEGRRPEEQLAAWRNALWPLLHANVVYEVGRDSIQRRTLGGTVNLDTKKRKIHHVRTGSLMFFRRRVHAMGPAATIEKFDQNAAGWNGDPSSASYPHFRWMRKFVACFSDLARDARLLDFGCGAGWCGIEAAKRFGASELAFFDPSPEMVKIAESNAREQGIANPCGRTGFGEQPPFPAPGEEAFDGVISSGVISFAPDADVWLKGLVPTIKAGGVLVIGDIQGTSRGMQRRRAGKALLPARELNAQTASVVRAKLEQHGFRWTAGAGYQLTRPFPEAMHVNESKLGGVLTYPLLWSNQVAAKSNRHLGLPGANQFDSWVMSFRRE